MREFEIAAEITRHLLKGGAKHEEDQPLKQLARELDARQDLPNDINS